MGVLHIKNRLEHLHFMRGTVLEELKGIAHDRYFWDVIAVIAIISLLVVFFAYLVWANPSMGGEEVPMYPGYPFVY